MDTPTPEQCEKPGFPNSILAKLAKSDPTVTIEGMNDQGDIRFTVDRQEVGMYPLSVTRAPMAWNGFFINTMGEVLVRKNIGRFADMLGGIEVADYDRIVNGFIHREFGLEIEDDGRLRFQFHISLIQKILTEDLEPLLKSLE